MLLWFFIGAGVLIAGVAVRDLLRRPDKTAKPDYRPEGRAGRSYMDSAKAWDALNNNRNWEGPGGTGM